MRALVWAPPAIVVAASAQFLSSTICFQNIPAGKQVCYLLCGITAKDPGASVIAVHSTDVHIVTSACFYLAFGMRYVTLHTAGKILR